MPGSSRTWPSRPIRPPSAAARSGRRPIAPTPGCCASSCARGAFPNLWIPPAHVLEVRSLGRSYAALMDERRAWQQRIHAQLFHQGVPPVTGLLTVAGRTTLTGVALSPAGRRLIDVALTAIDGLSALIVPLRAELTAIGRRWPGPRALTTHYGIGPLCAAIIWAELGDPRRFRSSDQAVRFSGLDITVWSSDGRRARGRLARQGPPELRWALYEAAKCAARSSSPDHDYYAAISARLGGKRPTLSVARKLARRCYHTLRELGDTAWLPVAPTAEQAA